MPIVQPTMCSSCGGTHGKCESCRKNTDQLVAIACPSTATESERAAMRTVMEGMVIKIVDDAMAERRAARKVDAD